jgi:hypothetical protein
MSSLMIRCPNTGRSVSTAIEIESSVLHQLPNIRGRMICPICGQEHFWMTQAAWLAGEPRLAKVMPAPTGEAA